MPLDEFAEAWLRWPCEQRYGFVMNAKRKQINCNSIAGEAMVPDASVRVTCH